MKVPFLDLRREYKTLKKDIDSALSRVVSSGNYILGQEVQEFEKTFAKYIGVKYAIGVGSGTEALQLALLASGVKSGDEVITAANTCGPTISAIMAAGAVPVLIDVDPQNYCLNVSEVARKITRKTKAIVPVHLYGQVVDLNPIMDLSKQYSVSIIEDCAQAHGARYKTKKAGSIGDAGAFSFYPTKNMGAFGDGGIITTNSRDLANKCRLLRNYGQKNRYEHELAGFNSRLDELQAAILRIKLGKLDEWNMRRREIAKKYNYGIDNPNISLPIEMSYAYHIYHLYVIRVKSRKTFMSFLAKYGISTLIHYPIPMHRQRFYIELINKRDHFPVADELATQIISLPLYPYLKEEEVNHIIKVVNSYYPKS